MAENQQLMTLQKKVETVRDMLDRMKPQLALALPRHLTPDRLARVALTSILTTPKLLGCTPRSLAGAVLQCAQLGLEPGGVLGHAYLVPFANRKQGTLEVQLIPGYKGLVDLSRRSNQISTITADVVHAKDKYRVKKGLTPVLEHEPYNGNEDPGPVIAAYAIGRLKDGGHQFEWMWKREIDQVRDRYSRAAGEGPWITEFEAMAKKTVLRRLCKLLPASIETQVAVSLDERAEAGIPQDLSALVDGTIETSESPPSGPLDKLANSLEGQGAAESPPASTPAEEPPPTENGDEPPKKPRRRTPTTYPATMPPREPVPSASVGTPPSSPDALAGALTQIKLFTTPERLEDYVKGLYAPGQLRSKLIPQGQKLLDHAVGKKRDELVARSGEGQAP